jgi:hypothetical protein
MISRALLIIVIVSSFPVLQLPPKVLAQTPSEGAKVLIDDTIQALKSNDTERWVGEDGSKRTRLIYIYKLARRLGL